MSLDKNLLRITKLEDALHDLIKSGRAYMDYHTKKMGGFPPTGITPALDEAEKVLDPRK